ncbi:hypothetical protein [Nocardia sp. NPDC004711]
MTELTENRIREIVREEIDAATARQVAEARNQIAAGFARLGRRPTPAPGESTPSRDETARLSRRPAEGSDQ